MPEKVMNTCLICNKQEPGARASAPDVDIVCNDCLLTLTQSTQEQINKQYIEAIQKKQYGVAYAMYTFTSRKIRKEYPLKKRR